jgi:hypothetical protein
MVVVAVISLSEFNPVSLKDKDLFSARYRHYPQIHSDNVFSTMVCWNHYAHYQFAQTPEHLVISSTIEGNTKFRYPVGPPDEDLTREVLLLAREEGDQAPFLIFGDVARAELSIMFPHLPVHSDRDLADYVYLSSELADLPGKKYLTIRHQLNRFRARCAYAVEPVTSAMIDEVREFLVKWCEWRDCDSIPVLASEKEALQFAIDHFPELSLEGLVIRVDDQIGSMALFEPLNEETAVIHFEKGLPECQGIYKAINAETASRLRPRFLYINRESDMGVPGLREAKLRYHPHHLTPVYLVHREDITMDRIS